MKIELLVLAVDHNGNRQEIVISMRPDGLSRNGRHVTGSFALGEFAFDEKGDFDAFADWPSIRRAHAATPPTGPELAARHGFEPLAPSGAERVQGVASSAWPNGKHTCPSCGKPTRDTTAGCDHCDLEDK